MSGHIKFTRSSKGFKAMLRSPEAQKLVNEAAAKVAARAGDGFDVEPRTLSRTRAYVKPTTKEARAAAARHALEFAAIREG
ncbi:hypothetical protein [Actinomyces culturomici]|uniref:hypothetical protein n=1 Tax=Actinomyces culturomici TaxID=1926276 RepID=UPI000E1FC58A|nr:hypothetical protein [Actinomyces culturomici]